MPSPLIDEYARILHGLEGSEFQAEVSARLATVIVGFQSIPAKPHGDAGLDGLSHNGTRAYCCYGMEHQSHQDNQSREKALVRKFSGDLCRIFELEVKNRALVHKATSELQRILPAGRKLLYIELVSNWFESHRVIEPLLTRLAEYTRASHCKYVSPDVKLAIAGPKDLANRYAVDEVTIARATARGFVDRVREGAKGLDIDDPMDFDLKMATLRGLVPGKLSAVNAIADGLRADWRTALAFERELADTVPDRHRALESARSEILISVSALMLASQHPWTELLSAKDLSHKILERDLGPIYGSLLPQVSSGEVARLIGECPIGWQDPGADQ